MMVEDDADSLSLSSDQRIRGDVPTTVMLRKPPVGRTNDREKRNPRPSACSSVTSMEDAQRRGHKNASNNKPSEKEINVHLRAELAVVKTEVVKSHGLIQKLIRENEMLRKEANKANARANRLEKVVGQLPSPVAALNRTWQNASHAFKLLQYEGPTSTKGKENESPDGNSSPGDEDSVIMRGLIKTGTSIRSILQPNSIKSTDTPKHASNKKIVSTEELIIHWDEGRSQGKKTDCDTSETANDPPAASPISSRPVTALQSNYNNSQPKNERVPIVNLQCITDNTLFPGADMWDVEDCASVVPSVASSKKLST